VFISHVDSGLEKLLRTRLPLPEELGDISFDPPSGTWSAQLSRITVNLFLYDVQRSTMPSAPMVRTPTDGPAQRRRAQPMIQLGYLVSAWAGSPRDEHQLLGDVVSIMAGVEAIPVDLLPDGLSSTVRLSMGDPDNRSREIWSASGGSLKASFSVMATVAADSFGWELLPPLVERIEAMASRMDERADA
jgi:Pvc16 N-terminal domain